MNENQTRRKDEGCIGCRAATCVNVFREVSNACTVFSLQRRSNYEEIRSRNLSTTVCLLIMTGYIDFFLSIIATFLLLSEIIFLHVLKKKFSLDIVVNKQKLRCSI